MARASHERSRTHIDALRANLSAETDQRMQQAIANTIANLEGENARRRKKPHVLKLDAK